MPELTEPLRELTRKWRTEDWREEYALDERLSESICADELESLIPPIEKGIAERYITGVEHNNIVTEFQRKLLSLEAEISALTTLMDCGHSKACQKEFHDGSPGMRHNGTYCAACVQQEKAVRLERAAAHLQDAAKVKYIADESHKNGHTRRARMFDALSKEIALLSDSDRSALAQHDNDLIERMKDHLVSMDGWMPPEALDAFKAEVQESEANWIYQEARGARWLSPDMEGYIHKRIEEIREIRARKGSKP